MTSAGDNDFHGDPPTVFPSNLIMVQRDEYGLVRGKWRKRNEARDTLLYRAAPAKPYQTWPGAYWPRVEELEHMPRSQGIITWRLAGGRVVHIHELMWPDGTLWRVPDVE